MNTHTRLTAVLLISLAALTFVTTFLIPSTAHACGELTVTCSEDRGPNGSGGYSVSTNACFSGYGEVSQNDSCPTGGDNEIVPGGGGGGGSVTPPTASIIATPSTVQTGGTSQLTWTSTNAGWCTGTNFNANGSTGASAVVTLSATTVYTVTCENDAGSTSASATVTVNPAPAPTVSLTATPSSIVLGLSSVLAWISSNAASCTLDQGIGSVSPNSAGQRTVSPGASLTYSITCYGAGTTSGTGTWTYKESDISDFFCPLTDLNKAYTNTPNCPTSPAGKSCTPGTTCKINTASGCNINTDIYTCNAGSSAYALQGGMQCSGGTHVASWSDTQDGVGFTQGTGTMNAECDAITPAGGCCQVEVREVVNSTGQPVNTYYTGKAYTGATLVQRASYSAPSGSNTSNYSFFAGLKEGSVAPGTWASAYATVVVTNLPDLQVGEINGGNYTIASNIIPHYIALIRSFLSSIFASIAHAAGSPVAGQPAKLWTPVTNPTSTAIPQTFYNKFYVDLNNDNASAPGGMPAVIYSSWDATYDAPLSGLPVNTTNDAISLIAAGLPAGSHAIVFCADVTNTVAEQNESDNCTPKTVITVTNPYSCSASPTTATTSQLVTWTATVPATGTYTYSWSGTNSLSGTSKSVSKTYTTTGTKTASVTITANGIATPVTCSNSVVVSATLPDLTVGAVTPTTSVATVSKTFQATITNGSTASTGNSYAVLFQRATDSAGTGTTDVGTVVVTTTAGNATKTASVAYAFPSAGTWYMRAYADKASSADTGTIAEANENNNYGPWTPVVVSAPAVTASCSKSPTSGYVGDTIVWTAAPSGGTGVYTYVWTGSDALSGTGASVSKSYSSSGTKTASVTVSSGGNSATIICTPITINNPPTALLSANPSTIILGESPSTLTWVSSNATSCSSTKFSTGNAPSGSKSVSPSQNTTYDLTCTDGTRNAFSNATVTVAPINLTLNVSPQKVVRQGNPATVTWGVVGSPDTCLISGPGLSSTAFSGSQQVIITKESTYLFTCTVNSVSTSKSVTIGLTPHFEEF